jgi:hypothetical protein
MAIDILSRFWLCFRLSRVRHYGVVKKVMDSSVARACGCGRHTATHSTKVLRVAFKKKVRRPDIMVCVRYSTLRT